MGRTALFIAGLAALLAAARGARAETAAPPAAKDPLYAELVAALDRFERGGRWKDSDSGILAWSCGQYLRALVELYQATGDQAWLDRFFKYADTMFANLTPNRDGVLGWRTSSYSTKAGEPLDFAVHDGVVLTPICRAIEVVKKDPALAPAYGARADRLLAVIETKLVPKWDKCRRQVKEGAVVVYPDDPALGAERGITQPHNQYLALGSVEVALFRITGKAAWREHAAGMASFFKSRLRTVGDRYEWNYWDASGEWDAEKAKTDHPRAEDTGHGSLDIAFAIACAESGIVFDEADLKRFANTFVKAMWNGSLDDPVVGGWVNRTTPSRQSGNVQDWLLLSRLEPRILEVCNRVIPKEGSTAAKAQLFRLRAEKAKAPAARE